MGEYFSFLCLKWYVWQDPGHQTASKKTGTVTENWDDWSLSPFFYAITDPETRKQTRLIQQQSSLEFLLVPSKNACFLFTLIGGSEVTVFRVVSDHNSRNQVRPWSEQKKQ